MRWRRQVRCRADAVVLILLQRSDVDVEAARARRVRRIGWSDRPAVLAQVDDDGGLVLAQERTRDPFTRLRVVQKADAQRLAPQAVAVFIRNERATLPARGVTERELVFVTERVSAAPRHGVVQSAIGLHVAPGHVAPIERIQGLCSLSAAVRGWNEALAAVTKGLSVAALAHCECGRAHCTPTRSFRGTSRSRARWS